MRGARVGAEDEDREVAGKVRRVVRDMGASSM